MNQNTKTPADTLVDRAPPRAAGLDDTQAAAGGNKPALRGTVDGFIRTTVLPRAEAAAPVAEVGRERRFEVQKVLGAGGMGEVALVEDRDIQRKVALKRLRSDARTAAGLQRFAEEVRIIGQLEHPNITPVHDVGIDEDGQHYFVMKFVDGETVESIIAKLKAGDPATLQRYGYEQRIEILIGILNALRYAHARKIIHRDLKPANIMVGRFGEVTVVDWGIARKIDPTTQEAHGTLVGTPMYMSPEQAAGDHAAVDERSDIYSLSLVLLELLTLSHPLADKPSMEAILATLVTDGVDASLMKIKLDLVKAGAPADYAAVLARGLQRDPARRYASVDEMERAVKDVREGRVPVSCHITLTKRAAGELVHWIDRSPMLFSLFFFAAVAGLGLGVYFAIAHFLR